MSIKQLPENFGICTDTPLTLHNPKDGVVIDVWERDIGSLQSEYPYKVVAAKEQDTEYTGVFRSINDAEEKAHELAHTI